MEGGFKEERKAENPAQGPESGVLLHLVREGSKPSLLQREQVAPG